MASDAQCTTQSFLDQKNGEINFIQQNTDLSYNIEYLMEIGQGVKQIFFDIIAREKEKTFILVITWLVAKTTLKSITIIGHLQESPMGTFLQHTRRQ